MNIRFNNILIEEIFALMEVWPRLKERRIKESCLCSRKKIEIHYKALSIVMATGRILKAIYQLFRWCNLCELLAQILELQACRLPKTATMGQNAYYRPVHLMLRTNLR